MASNKATSWPGISMPISARGQSLPRCSFGIVWRPNVFDRCRKWTPSGPAKSESPDISLELVSSAGTKETAITVLRKWYSRRGDDLADINETVSELAASRCNPMAQRRQSIFVRKQRRRGRQAAVAEAHRSLGWGPVLLLIGGVVLAAAVFLVIVCARMWTGRAVLRIGLLLAWTAL